MEGFETFCQSIFLCKVAGKIMKDDRYLVEVRFIGQGIWIIEDKGVIIKIKNFV